MFFCSKSHVIEVDCYHKTSANASNITYKFTLWQICYVGGWLRNIINHNNSVLPGQCSWSSQLGRPRTHTWHRTACWMRAFSWKENYQKKWTSVKCQPKTRVRLVRQWRNWQCLPDSCDSASLVVVNLALWLSNFETLSYLTPGPMMNQPPSMYHARGLAESSCLSAGKERERQRVHMSLYMCNDPELDSWFSVGYLAMT